MSSDIKFDWYQTEDKVVITVLIKNAKDYKVDIHGDRVVVTVDENTLPLQLLREIIPEKSSHKASSVKVEISLAKTISERWPSLTAPVDKAAEELPNKAVQMYKQDWNSLEKEIDKEGEDKKEVNQRIHPSGNFFFTLIYSFWCRETH